MAELIRCPRCGKEIPKEGTFCPSCGSKFSANRIHTSDNIRANEDYEKRKQQYDSELRKKSEENREQQLKKEKLLKKKSCLKLKLDNYENLMAGKIPNCSLGIDAPDMPKTEAKEDKTIWYIMAAISLVEIIAGFIPWITVYYGDFISGMSISCGSIFDLMQKAEYYSQWSDDITKMLYPIMMVLVANLVVIGINIYFLITFLQKKYDELEYKAEAAGGTAIGLSILMLFMIWWWNSNASVDSWRLISVHQESGVWVIMASGIAMMVAVYKAKEIYHVTFPEQLSVDVTNFDPVLPIRFGRLKVRREDNFELRLDCKEFDCEPIEEIVAGIQLVKNTGRVETLIRNVTFKKKGDGVFEAEIPDANYDFDPVSEARINVVKYIMMDARKEVTEFGSGYSVMSDFTVDELGRLKRSGRTPVWCIEKELGEDHQCSCGQIYSQKVHICPLCGKERKA